LLLAAMKGHTDIVRDILSLKGVMVNLEDKVSCVCRSFDSMLQVFAWIVVAADKYGGNPKLFCSRNFILNLIVLFNLLQEGRLAVFAAQNDEITALINFYGMLFRYFSLLCAFLLLVNSVANIAVFIFSQIHHQGWFCFIVCLFFVYFYPSFHQIRCWVWCIRCPACLPHHTTLWVSLLFVFVIWLE